MRGARERKGMNYEQINVRKSAQIFKLNSECPNLCQFKYDVLCIYKNIDLYFLQQ